MTMTIDRARGIMEAVAAGKIPDPPANAADVDQAFAVLLRAVIRDVTTAELMERFQSAVASAGRSGL